MNWTCLVGDVFVYEVVAISQMCHYGEDIAVLNGWGALKSSTYFWTRRKQLTGLYYWTTINFRNNMTVPVLHAFLGYSLTGTKDEASVLVDASVVCLACLSAWVDSVVKCVTETKTEAGHQQKLGTDTYGRLLLKWSSWLNICVPLWSTELKTTSLSDQEGTLWKWCNLHEIDKN